MKILVLNSGSSSLKYRLFDMTDNSVLATGNAERIGMVTVLGKLVHKVTGGDDLVVERRMPDHKEALKQVLEILTSSESGVVGSLDDIAAVGHRVVHGKETFTESTIIDSSNIDTLKALTDLAPLHMPPNIMGIESCMTLMPQTPQVAVFDTSFHQSMPSKAFLYALPYELYKEHGIRRYGFHGTSHRYVATRTAEILDRDLKDLRMVTLHLGNGSSGAAIKKGKVVDTSMGFTPLEGFVMGTRCGDLDPALAPYIAEKLGMSNTEVDGYLNKQSGLIGYSGVSSDMRDIQTAIIEGNQRAKDIYDVFIYRLIKYVGAYYAAMGGLDVLVFTAGIGENDHLVREHVCQGVEVLGVKIDVELNASIRAEEAVFSTSDSKVKVLLVPTNEELMIAIDAIRLVQSTEKSSR